MRNVKPARTPSGGGACDDDWRGCGGAKLPHVRETKSKLSRPPFRARRDNAAMRNENRPALAGRPPRGCKRGRRLRRKLPGPPCKGEPRELTTSASDERKASDNHQWRRGLKGLDDWGRVWEGQGPSQWRNRPFRACDDCLAGR